MKGKKFNAAEKHFKKKEDEYKVTIRKLEETQHKLMTDIIKLKQKCCELECENNSLKLWVARLLDYVNMDAEEFKKHIKDAQTAANAVSLLSAMGTFLKYGG